MTTSTLKQRDHLIQEDVSAELSWAPQVEDAHIGVSVLDGVVTLSGETISHAERVYATKAALRVKGVTVVADDLTIRDRVHAPHTDTDIAAAVKQALDWAAGLPQGSVKADVRDHDVTLIGTVPWNYQRSDAARLVRAVKGVQHVENRLALTPRISAPDTAKRIKAALVRHALQDADAISVTATGSEVTLTGTVGTWAEKNDADHAAWSSPHTSAVHNNIVVSR